MVQNFILNYIIVQIKHFFFQLKIGDKFLISLQKHVVFTDAPSCLELCYTMGKGTFGVNVNSYTNQVQGPVVQS